MLAALSIGALPPVVHRLRPQLWTAISAAPLTACTSLPENTPPLRRHILPRRKDRAPTEAAFSGTIVQLVHRYFLRGGWVVVRTSLVLVCTRRSGPLS